MKKERDRFSNLNFSGTGGGLLLFPNTYTDIEQIKTSAYNVDEAQLNMIQANVFNYFGVNADLLQGKATSDELDVFFNTVTEPFEIQLSEALTDMTFTGREQSAGNKVDVVANRLQYASMQQRILMAQQLGDRGMILIDEIRELFNYPPLPDGTGQRAPIRGEYYMVGEEGSEQDETES